MEPSLDTGPILATGARRRSPTASTAASLHDELAAVAARHGRCRRSTISPPGARSRVPQPECGRHLCRQDRQGGGPARLDATGRDCSSASCARSIPGPAAGPSSTSSGSACSPAGWCAAGHGARAGRGAGRAPDRRLRRGRAARSPGAASGRQADAGRSVPARLRRAGRHAAGPAMPRYKLTLEYDGGPFRGWQRQSGPALGAGRRWRRRSQAFCGEAVQVVRRRPDRCRRACAAARSRISISGARWRSRPCATRSTTICGRSRSWCWRRPRSRADFHARFSARARHYRYLIVNRPAAAGAGARPRLAGARPARCRGHARGRLAPARPARLHELSRRALPGQIAGQDARLDERWSRRGDAGRDRARGRAPSCTIRCATWSAR